MKRTIAERIRARREELGMSQEELALKLGYKNRSSINKIEKSAQKLTQTKIMAVAKALETTPEYIMGWGEEETAPNDYHTEDERLSFIIDVFSKSNENEKALILQYFELLKKAKKGGDDS